MQKNISLYSEEEVNFFLSYKESQYASRRDVIEEHCTAENSKRQFGKKVLKNSLIYDEDDGISYCQVR